jgi:hypothetical protein
MSKLARTLALVAMLAAMAVTGMTAVAQAHVADQAVRRPPTEERIDEHRLDRPAPAADQSTPDARLRLLLARERFSYPSDVPAQATSPIRPAEHGGRAGWLAPALTGLALVALIAGVTVISARRANRVQRAGQTA